MWREVDMISSAWLAWAWGKAVTSGPEKTNIKLNLADKSNWSPLEAPILLLGVGMVHLPLCKAKSLERVVGLGCSRFLRHLSDLFIIFLSTAGNMIQHLCYGRFSTCLTKFMDFLSHSQELLCLYCLVALSYRVLVYIFLNLSRLTAVHCGDISMWLEDIHRFDQELLQFFFGVECLSALT